MSQIFLFYWIYKQQDTRPSCLLSCILPSGSYTRTCTPYYLSSTNGVHVYILLVVLIFCLGHPSYFITYKDPVHTYVFSSVYKNALSTGLYHTPTTDYVVLSLVL